MKSKNVLVTGASTGIGEACALHLDVRGFRVFAGVRKEEDAERLSRSGSDRLTPVFLDVVDEASIEQARSVIGNDEGLGGLVNNAGISIVGPLEFVRPENLRRQFDVNVFGQVAVTQAFLPLLRKAKGRIVNMSSISGRTTVPFLAPYSMSKFALEAYTDGLRRELMPWGVDVACIEPGSIDTPIWRKSMESARADVEAMSPEARELYGKEIDAVFEGAEQAAARAAPVDLVARAVHHALTASRPKTRYLVGKDAKAQALLKRFLSDRMLDKVYRKFLKLD